MRYLIIILILVGTAATVYCQRSAIDVPVHSIHSGFFATTSGGKTGLFLDYQYYKDDVISYSAKSGVTGIFDDKDTTNYFLHIGVNFRFNALRKPLRKRPFNSQPYAGFYPLSIDYLKVRAISPENPDSYRMGLVPSGVIGYTLIFYNRLDVDMHAGFGISFRLGGQAGSPVEPSAFAGIALGVRF